jgi:hypothetical protein
MNPDDIPEINLQLENMFKFHVRNLECIVKGVEAKN